MTLSHVTRLLELAPYIQHEMSSGGSVKWICMNATSSASRKSGSGFLDYMNSTGNVDSDNEAKLSTKAIEPI